MTNKTIKNITKRKNIRKWILKQIKEKRYKKILKQIKEKAIQNDFGNNHKKENNKNKKSNKRKNSEITIKVKQNKCSCSTVKNWKNMV